MMQAQIFTLYHNVTTLHTPQQKPNYPDKQKSHLDAAGSSAVPPRLNTGYQWCARRVHPGIKCYSD